MLVLVLAYPVYITGLGKRLWVGTGWDATGTVNEAQVLCDGAFRR